MLTNQVRVTAFIPSSSLCNIGYFSVAILKLATVAIYKRRVVSIRGVLHTAVLNAEQQLFIPSTEVPRLESLLAEYDKANGIANI